MAIVPLVFRDLPAEFECADGEGRFADDEGLDKGRGHEGHHPRQAVPAAHQGQPVQGVPPEYLLHRLQQRKTTGVQGNEQNGAAEGSVLINKTGRRPNLKTNGENKRRTQEKHPNAKETRKRKRTNSSRTQKEFGSSDATKRRTMPKNKTRQRNETRNDRNTHHIDY